MRKDWEQAISEIESNGYTTTVTENNIIFKWGGKGDPSREKFLPLFKIVKANKDEIVNTYRIGPCGDKTTLPPSHAGSTIPDENVATSDIVNTFSGNAETTDGKEADATQIETRAAPPLPGPMTDNHPNQKERSSGKDEKAAPYPPVPPTEPLSRPNGPLHIKYRPRTWDEIWGNEEVVELLKSSLSKPAEKRPHVFLLQGPSGCGKTTLARIIKKELGCADLYYNELNVADTRGIDRVRYIISECQNTPWMGSVKIYVLDEFHQITKEAQNALLKILEDTPRHVYFILCTTEPKKIIRPIRTRSATYQVNSLPPSLIRDLLNWVCNEERKEVSNEALEVISRTCEGSSRQALVSLDQVIDINDPQKALKIITQASFQEKERQSTKNSCLTSEFVSDNLPSPRGMRA